MSTPPARDRALSRLLRVRPSGEGDRVTMLELFFDLVFVFAFTQVTFVMSHGEPPLSVLQGMVVLALLWWWWTSYTWLGNQARADEGLVRVALVIAMGAVFVMSLTIPEAYHDLEGGLYAPIVFVVCYAVIRLVHLATYLVAAGGDAGLRRQVLLSLIASALPSIVLLTIGALAPEEWRVWIWLAAILIDLLAIFVTSLVGGSWRLRSVAHFAERHRLVVILALGEGIVAIGVGVSLEPVTTAIIVGSLLAVGLSVSLWWAYFAWMADMAEEAIEARDESRRVRAAADGYTYLHLPIVAGVILVALGIEEVMGHLGEEHLGALGAGALGAGVAVFLAATAGFWARVARRWLWPRLVAAVLAVALIPLLASLPGLVALGVVLVLMVALGLAESLAPPRGSGRSPEIRRDQDASA